MADRIGILAHGRLVAEGTFAELRGDREATLEDLFLELTRAA
jgi:ABC-2 type transport system ATP-binding protein